MSHSGRVGRNHRSQESLHPRPRAFGVTDDVIVNNIYRLITAELWNNYYAILFKM